MAFIDEMKAKARMNKKTIVLPESEDKRTYEAIETVLKEGTANIILVGNSELVSSVGAGYDITGALVVDPKTYEKSEEYVDALYEMRKSKGMSREEASALIYDNYTYFAVMMVKFGDADGMVSGACHSTADTLRPSLQIIKTAPGSKLVSSFFIMEVPDCELGENGTFAFGDCALEQNPSPEKLASIAGTTAKSFKALVGKEPRVALLSHSSYGSAKHADVDKVVEAVKIAKEEYPDLMLDGELQLDAAIVPEVGKLKAPDSKVAGQANCLIFPDIDAGNIGYKLVQRLAKAEAYGPMTQGLAAPVNDLSRGCYASDIVGVIAITVVQCQEK